VSKTVVLTLLAVLAACGNAPEREAATTRQRPNVLLIVADDLGYSDVGVFGGEIATPNIDGLARAGILFTQFHVAPNCGPTRGSLLTGVDFHRAGMGGNPEVTADNQKGLPAYQGHLRNDVVTVAELLQEAGYHTYMADEDSSDPSLNSTVAPATGQTRRRSFQAARPNTPRTINR
jgi:arylsulfatase A-like enzyme